MNILGNNQAKMNNVIFANRNKEYGAYAIRAEYNESIRKSLFIMGGFVVALFVFVYTYNKTNAHPSAENTIIVDDLEQQIYETTEVDVTPIEETQIQQTETASAAPNTSLGTRIVDSATETNSVNIENPINGQGTPDANGTSLTSSVVTTNTVAATSTPVNTVATTETLILVDDMPEFEGGVAGLMRYVGSNISYPEQAKVVGKEGTVYVSFVVSEVGMVENVKVMRGIGYGCDEEVVRVVSNMPKWKKAGKNAGHPVKVRFNIPVKFSLK